MTILHYTHKFEKGDLLSDYLNTLISNQRKENVEVKVVRGRADFKQAMLDAKPNIVHIHTCWNYNAFLCAKAAKKQGCAVVFSPHWGLSPLIMKTEQPLRKKLRTLCYQRQMITLVDSIIVTTQEEKVTLKALGWNKRIDVAPASMLNSSISNETMVRQMLLIYTKVIDTRYRIYMSENEVKCLFSLLSVGLQQTDGKRPLLPSEAILQLRKLTPVEWQRILLCADDEFVREYIDTAIERLQLDVPYINTADIIRYNPKMPKAEGDIEQTKSLSTNYFSRSRIEDAANKEDNLMKGLTLMIANAQQLIKQQKISLRHLSNIYTQMRYKDYDEDKIEEVLKQMRLTKFARRLLHVFAQNLYLEEGYMPFTPLNDKKTRLFINKLINKNRY
ncbi:glycosyltransferase [Prevotella ihumii]|uniref:glycosyltransferase n=1 Tax=Prevotella ihumii TaxID=1917878 RepID=UPI000981A4A7|nr:glycosyltransferase [Prevotella ihumii]